MPAEFLFVLQAILRMFYPKNVGMGMKCRETGYKPTKTGYQASEYTVDHSVTADQEVSNINAIVTYVNSDLMFCI